MVVKIACYVSRGTFWEKHYLKFFFRNYNFLSSKVCVQNVAQRENVATFVKTAFILSSGTILSICLKNKTKRKCYFGIIGKSPRENV